MSAVPCTASPVPCRICGGTLDSAFTGAVLGDVPVTYSLCTRCGSLLLPDPHWLDRAYASHPVPDPDSGMLRRTLFINRALRRMRSARAPFAAIVAVSTTGRARASWCGCCWIRGSMPGDTIHCPRRLQRKIACVAKFLLGRFASSPPLRSSSTCQTRSRLCNGCAACWGHAACWYCQPSCLISARTGLRGTTWRRKVGSTSPCSVARDCRRQQPGPACGG